NAVFLCLLENIYKDTHFQPLDQIFKVKKNINKLLYIKHINQIFPKYCQTRANKILFAFMQTQKKD
ncbi:MAG: hypothetical protein IJK84_01785, partial [Bacteroidales bacterium]|nr:hypothetical protein [Bacteroidales bacterium]